MYVTAVTVLHLHILIYSPALLVLYSYFSGVCVCVCDPPHVCVLMHIGAAQARTRLQERQRVTPAGQVRDACDMMAAYVYYPT
jgi:hypothetical protein